MVGEQKISKFNEKQENNVQLYLAVIRLKENETEILICLNNPILIDPNSSSSSSSVSSFNEKDLFFNILNSFKIVNLSSLGI